MKFLALSQFPSYLQFLFTLNSLQSCQNASKHLNENNAYRPMLVGFLNAGLIGKDNYVVTDKSSMRTNKAKVLHTTFSCIAVIIWNTVLCKSHEPLLASLFFVRKWEMGAYIQYVRQKRKNLMSLKVNSWYHHLYC